jgi:uncharacterized membrane protein
VKVKTITIQGFRGFNKKQTIQFHNRLTLISAPNSYGKTSISEAFEWLLYGITSKVEKADSKDEYKGSYRNCHLSESLTPLVNLVVSDGTSDTELRGELNEQDCISRFVDGNQVEEWPFAANLSATERPFILQHALKYLLLVKPDDRFRGFARLLGLEHLDDIQRNFVSLCTKPDASIPSDVNTLIKEVNALESRLAIQDSLSPIWVCIKKGSKGLAEAQIKVKEECKRRVPPGTTEESILPQLLKIRDDAVQKIFKGRINLLDFSSKEKDANSEDESFFGSLITKEFIKKYSDLITLSTVQHILDRAAFFDLGVKLLDESKGMCPFCNRPIDDKLSEHICDENTALAEEKRNNAALEKQRTELIEELKNFRVRIRSYQQRNTAKTSSISTIASSIEKLKSILVPNHEAHFIGVQSAITALNLKTNALQQSYDYTIVALDAVETSISSSNEDSKLMKKLGECVIQYMADAHSFISTVTERVIRMAEADQILKHELDALAGTADISVLVDLVEVWRNIQKRYAISDILDSLKGLRKTVDQYTANRVLTAISGELTSEVRNLTKVTGVSQVI